MERSDLLLSRDRSVLIVVDMQEPFLSMIKVRDLIERNIAFLLQVAKLLNVPILATLQNAERLGGVVPALQTLLPEQPAPIDKLCFSCLGAESFARALQETGRQQVVLTGIEAHICIMQTALDLLKAGYRVHVPYDAVASRGKPEWKYALLRLQHAGAVVTSVESVTYEWLYQAGTEEFRQLLPLIKEREQILRKKHEEADE
ncbi:MAG: hydrolase [Armatimonadota bacterium]